MLLADSSGRTAVATPRSRFRHEIEERDGRRTFVKAATDESTAADLRREAATLQLLHHEVPRCAAPRLVGWSEDELALRTEVVDGESLADRMYASGLLDVAAASDLGSVLALLHRHGRELAAGLEPARLAPVGVHRPTPADMRWLSLGAMDAIILLQGSPSLCAHLDRLCVPPARETLIHADVRLENVMVGGGDRVRLVDWEFAGAGEGLWDVALVMAWALCAWLSSVPQIPAMSPTRLMHEATLPLDGVRPGLRALWRAYRAGSDEAGSRALHRCLELVAVRLVQLAVDIACDHEDLRAVSAMHLQLAANLLDRPEDLSPKLLDLPLHA